MIILEKSECILFYSVNNNYFDKFNEFFCVGRCASHWITSESDTATFIYDLKLVAYDLQSGESFIECKSEMTCTAKMEDLMQDSLQMLTVVKKFHQSIKLFISNNSLSYTSKLSWNYDDFAPDPQEMQVDITRLKGMKRDEDKTEIEKKLERNLPTVDFVPKANKSS
ncbi:MAG TPA: hypothetical protein VK668_06755 [Mucilaginibacter sp.]|nr:hypothetical protein [Mucilaginibacter sp.]